MTDKNVDPARRRARPARGRRVPRLSLALITLAVALGAASVSFAAPLEFDVGDRVEAPSSTTATFPLIDLDPTGVLSCALDGAAPAACSDPIVLEGLEVGEHTLVVTATNSAGEQTPKTKSFTVVPPPPPPPPTVAFSDQPRVVTNETTATFVFASSEPEAPLTCTRAHDGRLVEVVPCASPLVLEALPEGGHRVTVTAGSGPPATYAWTIDTTVPELTVEAAGPGSSPTFSFSSEPGVTFACSLQLALTTARAAPRLSPCPEGKKSYVGLETGTVELTVLGQDAAGNETLRTRRWTKPVASFTASPAALVEGATVTLRSTSRDAEGDLVAQGWDLDGDGAFDDGAGAELRRELPAGVRVVGLRVRDGDGLEATAFATLTVTAQVTETPARAPMTDLAPAPPVQQAVDDAGTGAGTAAPAPALRAAPAPAVPAARVSRPVAARPVLLNPFPVVRIAGEVFRSHTRVRMLTALVPRGGRLELRCRGRRCPLRDVRMVAPTRGPGTTALLRVRRVERFRLPAGIVLEIRVTRAGSIGKFTRFRIRAGGSPPTRNDRCLMPGSRRAVSCPA